MKVLLIVYDNGSYIHEFPMGIAYIASIDQFHYSEEHLTRYLTENLYDVVGLSVIGGYYQ